ncbi:MAG: hypothetical protein NTZ33_15730 [Bacteroidetes bacterium]|nr:hypothetical protein [Bacteroidota bacterium]
MNIIFLTLILLNCFIIFYQDYKSRAVMWIFFPTLFLLLFIKSFLKYDIHEILFNKLLLNLLILIIISCSVIIYFSFKGKKIKSIINEMIGWGDIFFLFAITPIFNPIVYSYFIIIGALISIIGKLIFDYINKSKSLNIPFAGNLALILSIILILIDLKIFTDTSIIYSF